MKKDRFPDIKIEIRSEGLAKKILGKPEVSTPSVYGEEQPEGKNLPNVEIKGKNKELQSLLETSNKKPNYTGLVKEAIFELRKQPEGQYGQFQPGGVPKKTKDEAASKRIASTIGTTSPESAALQSAPTSESKKYSTELTGQTAGVPQKKTTTETVENVRGTMTGTPDETAPGMPGAGGVRRLYSVESKPKGFDSADVSQTAAAAGTGKSGMLSDRKLSTAAIDYGSIGSMGAPGTGTKGKDTGPAASTEMPSLVGGPDVDEDVLEGRSSGTLPPDKSTEGLVVGGPGEGLKDGEGLKEGEVNTAATSATGATATGFTPTKERPAIPETDESKEAERAGTPQPLLNSSGYYSAVLQIGELQNSKNPKDIELISRNYGVKSLSEFLDLYKAVTPKSITAKPKANVTGVNMSSTVVSGAGTMQKGKIKAERSVPARTRPKKRVPKLIKSERPAMDNTLKYIIKEAFEEFKLEKKMGKPALEKQEADDPSTFSSRRLAYGDVGAGQVNRPDKAEFTPEGRPAAFQPGGRPGGFGKRPGAAFTRMTESGIDEYGSPDQFQVTRPKDVSRGS